MDTEFIEYVNNQISQIQHTQELESYLNSLDPERVSCYRADSFQEAIEEYRFVIATYHNYLAQKNKTILVNNISEDDKQKFENMRKLKENIDLHSVSDEDLNRYNNEYGTEETHMYQCPYCLTLHDSDYELEKCIKECE